MALLYSSIIIFYVFIIMCKYSIIIEVTVYFKALLHYALFHWHFLFFIVFLSFFRAFFLAFLIPHVGIKNTRKNKRKMQEDQPIRERCKKTFLYHTMHWVKTCESRFFSHCGTFEVTNTNRTHNVIWGLYSILYALYYRKTLCI